MNLKEYSEQVLRPAALNAVKEGRVDYAIQLYDVLDFYKDDVEMMQAIEARLKVLNEKP